MSTQPPPSSSLGMMLKGLKVGLRFPGWLNTDLPILEFYSNPRSTYECLTLPFQSLFGQYH